MQEEYRNGYTPSVCYIKIYIVHERMRKNSCTTIKKAILILIIKAVKKDQC